MGAEIADDPRSRRALTAGRLAFVWSSVIALLGVVLVVALPLLIRATEDGYCENIDHPGPCSSTTEMVVPGLAVTAVAAWSMAASVGLLRRHRWAKRAVVVTFSLWGLAALGAFVSETTVTDGRHLGALATWLCLLGYFGATVAFAVTGRVDDHRP